MREHREFGKRTAIDTENSIMRRMVIKRFLISDTVELNDLSIDKEMENEFNKLCNIFGCVGPEKDRLKNKLQSMFTRL